MKKIIVVDVGERVNQSDVYRFGVVGECQARGGVLEWVEMSVADSGLSSSA